MECSGQLRTHIFPKLVSSHKLSPVYTYTSVHKQKHMQIHRTYCAGFIITNTRQSSKFRRLDQRGCPYPDGVLISVYVLKLLEHLDTT